MPGTVLGAKETSLLNFFFFPFSTAPAACGSSGLGGLKLPTPQPSNTHWILNPPSKAGDGNRVLRNTSWTHYHCSTMGTHTFFIFVCLFPKYKLINLTHLKWTDSLRIGSSLILKKKLCHQTSKIGTQSSKHTTLSNYPSAVCLAFLPCSVTL